MDRATKIDAYNRLLNAMLGYIQKKGLINYKQKALIMEYCKQDDNSKKIVEKKKIDKILKHISKRVEKRDDIGIPSYKKLKEQSSAKWGGDYDIDNLLNHMYSSIRFSASGGIDDFIDIFISRIKNEQVQHWLGTSEQQRDEENIDKSESIEKKSHTTNYGNGESRYLSEEHRSSTDYVKRKQKYGKKDKVKGTSIKQAINKDLERDEENIDKSESIEKKSHTTNYSNGESRYLSEEHKRSADYVKRKQNMEEKDVNNLDTVKDIMSREEKLFDETVKNGDYDFDLGKSYTMGEYERKKYLKKFLSATSRLRFLSKDCKRLDSFAANTMITSAKQIEDLIVKNLLEVNFDCPVDSLDDLRLDKSSELHKQTLLKSKYNPHKFLEQYKKLYDNYSKQFDKIPDEEKVKIKEAIHEKYHGVNFVPSPEDIIEKINSRIEKVMIDHNVGVWPEHKERLRGSYALTTYMKPRQIAGIEHSIKHAINKDATLKGKERILQYNYSVAISAKEKTDRPLTEICKEVLHEEPLFEEPKKEKESKSLIEKDKVKGFSFASIKQAIDKALGRDEHYR